MTTKKATTTAVKPGGLTNDAIYNRVVKLQMDVKTEMRNRQNAGLPWRGLHPVEQKLGMILQGMRIYLQTKR